MQCSGEMLLDTIHTYGKHNILCLIVIGIWIYFFNFPSYATNALGVCDIEDPEYNSNGSIYNRVYFGWLGGETFIQDVPIYWRVLSTNGSDHSGKPALFMLTEYVLPVSMQLNDIDDFLDKKLYQDCFSSEERDVILETTKNESQNIHIGGIGAVGSKIDNKKIFLLSAEEVLDKNYGFTPEHAFNDKDTNRCSKLGIPKNKNCSWWLRSSYLHDSTQAICIDPVGYFFHSKLDESAGVRVALNIPLSKIIFAQNANDTEYSLFETLTPLPENLTKTSFTYSTFRDYGNVTISPDPAYVGAFPAGAKLTILKNSSFRITQSKVISFEGEKIFLNYVNAETDGPDGKGYISVIIKDSDGNGLYHQTLKMVGKESSGVVSMTLPDNIPVGQYTLFVYNGVERGDYKTNYAYYSNVSLDIDTLKIDNPGVCNLENSDYVYFGCYDNNDNFVYYEPEIGKVDMRNKPIYWRVLNTKANDKDCTPAVFMLTNYCMPKYTRYVDKRDSRYTWKNNKIIKNFLNNNIYNTCFSYGEMDAIMNTYNVPIAKDGQIKGEKLFLLSKDEVLDTRYGFSYGDSRVAQLGPNLNKNCSWWLRSCEGGMIDYVERGGYLSCCYGTNTHALRFALNIPMTKILFVQNAVAEENKSISNFTKISHDKLKGSINQYSNYPDGIKLTILDENIHIKLDKKIVYATRGEEIRIGCETNKYYSEGQSYISAIIKDKNGDGIYHARLQRMDSFGGYIYMKMPSDIPNGMYTIIVYNEVDPGDYRTNYANYAVAKLCIHDERTQVEDFDNQMVSASTGNGISRYIHIHHRILEHYRQRRYRLP